MQVTGRRYDVILLGVDGTSLDSKLSEKLGVEHVMRTFGVESTKERLELYHEINEGFWSAFERGEVTKKRLIQERFNAFFTKLGIMVDGHATENLYRRQLDDSASLTGGTLDLCQYLKGWYDLYVVTNGIPSTRYKRLAAFGLNCFMKNIFVSEDVGGQKPQKECSEYCFERIPGVYSGHMLLVGDSPSSDIKDGQAIGIATC